MTETLSQNHKSGYVTLFGLPNAGKSTLMNRLLQIHLSIISARPQTTRRNVLGILNEPELQVIFLDTPGVVKPQYALHHKMLAQIDYALGDADLLLMLVDATKDEHPVEIDLQRMNSTQKPLLLLLNKIDLVEKKKLLPLIARYQEHYTFKAIIPISAETGDGLDELKNEMSRHLPLGAPFYPKDALTDQPERFFVAELIREQIFRSFHEEIPYATEVVVEDFKERKKGKDYIRAVIFVERESQKGILIGGKGEKLKAVGSKARAAIEKFLQRPVYLQLNVKLNEKWRRDEDKLRKMGY